MSDTYNVKGKLLTNTGHILSPKESKFIDLYVETGNGSQSVLDAGYKTKAPRQYARKLLTNAYIADEIAYRLQLHKNESIANRDEILQFLTKGMRGEMKDQFGLEMTMGDRLKFATELAKRTMDIEDRLASKNQEQPEIKIKLDFARPTQSLNVSVTDGAEITDDTEQNVDSEDTTE